MKIKTEVEYLVEIKLDVFPWWGVLCNYTSLEKAKAHKKACSHNSKRHYRIAKEVTVSSVTREIIKDRTK